jgi:hypothetical protein
MMCTHDRAVWRGSSWGVSVVKIVAERDREVLDVELEAETGPVARKPEGFSVLQESERAISALEAKVDGSERRRLKDR